MNYVERIGTDCSKWDGLKEQFGEDELLSMWVADMDFSCPECVVRALEAYARTPLGYFKPPQSYFDAVVCWEREHHGYEMKPEWICVTPGIVPAIHWAVRVFTEPGDNVMVSAPVYYPFMNAVNHCEGRNLIKNELVHKAGRWEIDFERYEQDIIKNNVKLYILCNPHNPVGRVWTAEELKTLMEICKSHKVMVIADEIHQDIVNPKLGRKKVTAATLGDYDDMIITMAAASKTFNLAAVQNSFIIIPDEKNRRKFQNFREKLSLNNVNGFGYVATEAALKGGEEWLQEVLQVIFGNYEYLKQRFEKECPSIKVTELEGTYLVWLDFSKLFQTNEEIKDFIQGGCKIAVDFGSWFGSQNCDSFVRMNLATSRENVKEACDRIIKAWRELEK